MSKLQKLIEKILLGRTVSYKEAEKLLLGLGFKVEISGSHHVFRKKGYAKNVSIKQRPQLLPYQLETYTHSGSRVGILTRRSSNFLTKSSSRVHRHGARCRQEI